MTSIATDRKTAAEVLIDKRTAGGGWTGRLSSSATATATAICALHLVDREAYADAIRHGLQWLARTALDDGSFGDSPESPGNLTTTLLAWSAMMADVAGDHADTEDAAGTWLRDRTGNLEPQSIRSAILAAYGKDQTFSVPVLILCTAMQRFQGENPWRKIPALPFEMAALPHSLWKAMNLHVVSYALPALISMGQLIHFRAPSRNPFARFIRSLTTASTLKKLAAIQPSNGGFLEAVPLCSFVSIAMAASGRSRHQVTARSISYIVRAQRPDGSWPIDEDLETWNTTLSINALAAGRRLNAHLDERVRDELSSLLINRQLLEKHPYTNAEPGGWAWTNLPGAVPDADDTSGALIALRHLGRCRAEDLTSINNGVEWLLDLQNKDGGIPTFCRGWGKLPFDRSCPDISAHALQAVSLWHPELTGSIHIRVQYFLGRIVEYLKSSQHADGSWHPLWFGNQNAPDSANPVFGTARALICMESLEPDLIEASREARQQAASFLVQVQNKDGSWGGDKGLNGSIEETSLALHALLTCDALAYCKETVRAREWLDSHPEEDEPAPIGLYFARLWYSEALYPLIFRAGAMEACTHYMNNDIK